MHGHGGGRKYNLLSGALLLPKACRRPRNHAHTSEEPLVAAGLGLRETVPLLRAPKLGHQGFGLEPTLFFLPLLFNQCQPRIHALPCLLDAYTLLFLFFQHKVAYKNMIAVHLPEMRTGRLLQAIHVILLLELPVA